MSDHPEPTQGLKAGGIKLGGAAPAPRSATISCLVENEAGVLARVIGLFSGRGYNIDSLTVAPVDESGRQSRINVVTSGTDMVIEQIKAQLDRLVPVHRVADLSLQGPHLARELAMIKVVGTGTDRAEALRLSDAFRARVIDATTESFVFELTGSTEKLRRLHEPSPRCAPWQGLDQRSQQKNRIN